MKKRRVGAALAAAALGVLVIAPASAANAEASESLDELLARVAPEVRENLYDDSFAARGAEAVTPATVPATGAEPITTHGPTTDVSIWLPATAAVAEDSVAGEGVRLFEHGNGATSVPLVKDDGSVQILTIIDASTAPESYSYSVDVPAGASLAVDEEGAVHITDAAGEFVGGVAPAWAVDANGVPVPTAYEVDGATLTQVVDHDAGQFAYPIVADPWLGQDLYYQPTVTYPSQGYKINVTPRAWGQQWAGPATWFAHVDEVKSKLGGNAWRWTNTIQEQFYCHIAGLPASLPQYNLESWRPLVTWSQSLAQYRCNPYDGAWS